MRRFALFLLLVLAVSHGWAHEECTVRPVKLELKFDRGELKTIIKSDADCWVDDILNVPFSSPLPALGWPEPMQKKAKDYIDKSFALRIDSQLLKADSMVCRYTQEPLTSTSYVVFELHYPMPASGVEISGRAQFFGDNYVAEKKSGHVDDLKNFYTTLHVAGARSLSFEIPFEKPDFSFPIDGLHRTVAQKYREKVIGVLYRVASSFVFWIFVIVAGVKIHTRYFKRREE